MLYERHKETLECKLTELERAERSKTFAEKHQELRDLQDEKKRTDERLNSRIKILTQAVDDLSEIVISGVEKRDVECETLPDWDHRQMYVIRTDTFAELPNTRRTMTVKEQQGELFTAPKDKADAAEPAEGETIPADSETNVRNFFEKPVEGGPEEIDAAPAEEAAQPQEDLFTAVRCEKCGRIDGAHAPDCGAIPYAEYLAFAQAKGLAHPKAVARKMELRRDRDEEVLAWMSSRGKREQLGYPAYLAFAKSLGLEDPETAARVMLEGRERDEEVYAFIDAQQKAAEEALNEAEREVKSLEVEQVKKAAAKKAGGKRSKPASGNARR